ncbi:hypothetical protein NDU88_000519 [Pleurodeles waltl]|uniref:Uncharacterized protein n=1 Tax=Pleurodeles waltl TaxID=8319 RepID=A0AAV7KY21_PLEWA|nr:hypothetical protein NDU88_000519 [Pleurodeles waltl]
MKAEFDSERSRTTNTCAAGTPAQRVSPSFAGCQYDSNKFMGRASRNQGLGPSASACCSQSKSEIMVWEEGDVGKGPCDGAKHMGEEKNMAARMEHRRTAAQRGHICQLLKANIRALLL